MLYKTLWKNKEMEKKCSLEERLSVEHPELLKRFEEIAALVENNEGDLVRADEAESRAIKEVRLLGSEIMHSWARRQTERTSQDFKNSTKEVRLNGKKKSTGIRHLEKSE